MFWVAGFLLIWAPGYLLALALRRPLREPPGVQLAIEIATGLAFWPLLLLTTSTAGISWNAAAGRATAAVVIGAALSVAAARSLRRTRLIRKVRVALPLGALTAAAVLIRWSHIRDLAFPPWVDALHHGMIVRLIAAEGAIPRTLEPFVEGGAFYYHWGYHATLSWLIWLLGIDTATALPRLMLDYGQMLNAATAVTMYAAGRVLLKSREGGLIAAALACFVSLYPAYYLSWGRYTHLAGTLILPPLLIVLWRLGSSRQPLRAGVLAVVLAAGLALVHVRVAFFAAVFMLVLAAVTAARRDWTSVRRWLLAGLVTAVVVLPWFWHVATNRYVREFVTPARTATPDIHQAVPLDILWSKHNRELLAVATCGLSGMAGLLEMPPAGRIASGVWWLLLIWASRFPARDARARRLSPWRSVALLAAFCAAMLALLFIRLPWIDLTRFASVSSAAITLFMPLSLAGAALITWFVHRTIPSRLGPRAAGVIALGLTIYGASNMVDIVNPVTRLADHRDARALSWIDTRLPANAKFAVDARPWMTPSWIGVDGGYWIGVATKAESILPPSIYAWSLPPARVEEINRRLMLWADRDPRALDQLRADGVTHVYVRARPGAKGCASLIGDDRLQLQYRDAGVCIFALAPVAAPAGGHAETERAANAAAR